MVLSKERVRSSYESSAWYYDLALRLYGLIGIGRNYRSRVVDLLDVQRGDTVVELGCGTGINFPLIEERIGPEGRLIGVDISPKMLDRARRQVERSGWRNVHLVQADISNYQIPDGVNGILSTGVFGYLDDPAPVVSAASQALAPGGHFVILDGKLPERMPSWLFRLFVWVSRPFGVTYDYFDKRTWEFLPLYFEQTAIEEMYGGMLFIARGTRGQHREPSGLGKETGETRAPSSAACCR